MTHPVHHIRLIAAALLLGVATVSACGPAYYQGGYAADGWEGEDAYWRNNYVSEPYYSSGFTYESYQPAYRYGVESYHRYNGRRFEELNESELRTNWERTHGRGSNLDWQHAHQAMRASYNHMAQNQQGHTAPAHGDHDHDDHHR